MITIEQIRLLEKKVHKAVHHIDLLTKENKALKSKLNDYHIRIDELEKLIESFKRDQGEIEQGIVTALEELNRLEDDLDTDGTDSLEITSENTDPVADSEPSPSPEEEPAPETEQEPEIEPENDSEDEEPDESSDIIAGEDERKSSETVFKTGELEIF